jgi:hypothetical protein
MHCIDCHTLADAMGDGNIWPNMDHAVEIECTGCHGTFERVSDLMTSRGRRVSNLHRKGDEFFLVSKVTGKRHKVVQVRHVLDQNHADFEPAAAAAMTQEHARLECYTCHSGWNPNFFGFHFDRNESFTQLDLISGQRTPGRVTTQEKVFATFSQLRLGINHEGMVAPYMVGFSTIGSAHGKDGSVILHQSTPETAAGLSGVTLIPHQLHTTRPEARRCVECHRSPTALGLGSVNFRLAREYGYAVNAAGLVTVAVDLKTPGRTAPVATLPLEGGPVALALRLDPVHARATHAYVAGEDGFLTVVSLRNPVLPQVVARKKQFLDPRRLLVQGRHLYAADGTGGVLILDLESPERPRQVGALPTTQARALALAFPWLLVADGPGGLVVADVGDPRHPRAIGQVDVNQASALPNEACDVTALFQFSRPRARADGNGIVRSRARHLAFVACGLDGVRIVDFSEPERPLLLGGGQSERAFGGFRADARGLAVNTVFDLGSAGGGLKSQERDYLYVYADEGDDQNRQQRVRVFDVTDPLRPRQVPRANARVYGGAGRLLVLRAYNAPFLQHFAVVPGAGGLGTLVDVSKTATGANVVATWDGVNGLRDLQFEELAFDRLQDEEGRWEKDISHEGCRYLTRDEILRVLRAPIELDPDRLGRYGNVEAPRREERK